MILECLTVGLFQENCYLLGEEESGEAILFDPGDEADRILEAVARHGLALTRIINTHGHIDHVGAVGRIQRETGADFYLHAADLFLLDRLEESAAALGIGPFEPPRATHQPKDGDVFRLGSISFRAVHMPGHSPGSLGYLFADRLIGGDVLFAGSIGRTDLPGADSETLMETLKTKILTLDDALLVHPGHGPTTSIRRERATNPFLLALDRRRGSPL
ncbi:MAG: MBL fold metallo-hydrolase [Candidatus Tectomicrobia bacterium]|nr:MBL fold metallo-hydrolase [Candidatus Tectomicrobia bacterium]